MKSKVLTLIVGAALTAGAAQPQTYPPPPKVDAADFGAGIQRTMTLLATSTPAHRNRVRILFYGQSITKQEWWEDVAADLRRRFPYADLEIANVALGGFDSPRLVRTYEHDVFPFYPDLVIFHDYGDEENYERIIAGIRQNTTAEILLQTDHVTWLPPESGEPDSKAMKAKLWHDRHGSEWLPQLARKYGCEVVDVRTAWAKYLKENRLKPEALLTDGVHLNAHGNFLMAELVKMHVRQNERAPETGWRDLVKTYVVGRDLEWKDGTLQLEFDGNRVEALTTTGGWARNYTRADVLIDGKRPSEFPELYAITRASDTFAVDWPGAIRISAEKPLLIEDWTAKILGTDDAATKLRFTVSGSRTGPDGEGVSTERFVSKSGRVVIEPGDWHAARAREYSKKAMPPNFEFHWSVVPLFTDVYEPPRINDTTREYATILAQGLANGRHRLEMRSTTAVLPQIEAIRVYRPPHSEERR